MLKQIKILFLGALAIAAVSCKTTQMADSHSTEGADFTGYKTYGVGRIDTTSINPRNAGYILQSVKTRLSAKGYTETTTSPDILVNISAVVKPKQTKVSNTNPGGNGSDLRTVVYWSQYNDPSLYTTVTDPKVKNGSLVITLTDAKTKRQIWEGSMSAELPRSSKNPEQFISEVVNKIMGSLPASS